MNKEEFMLFVEEVWEKIEDLRVGSGLSDEDVVMAVEKVRRRLLKRMEEENEH